MYGAYTYEQVKKEFNDKGYDLISTEYKKGSDKLKFICRKHPDLGEQTMDFYHLHHRNSGCKTCSKERRKTKRVSENELISICEQKNFTFKSVEYMISKGKKTPGAVVSFTCNNHVEKGIQTMPLGNLKRVAKGCKYCSGRYFSYDESVAMILNANPNIEVIEADESHDSTYICRCIIHDVIFKNSRYYLTHNVGCPKCGIEKVSKSRTKSQDQYIDELKDINPHLQLISEYVSAKDNVTCLCLIHNKTFSRNANSLLSRKSGCADCYREMIFERSGLKHEDAVQYLKEGNFSNVEFADEYKGRFRHTLFKCTKCERTWLDLPCNVYNRGCMNCNKNSSENTIAHILSDMNIDYVRQKSFDDCKDKKLLLFDFYIPDRNIIIEYDGEQHFHPVTWTQSKKFDAESNFLYTKRHDEIKNHYCYSNNIHIIRIPYWEKGNLKERLFRELSYKLTA